LTYKSDFKEYRIGLKKGDRYLRKVISINTKLFAPKSIRALVGKKSPFLAKVQNVIIYFLSISFVRSKYLISLSLSRKESFTKQRLLLDLYLYGRG
jgi:hypothetical protein